jgi:AcrR family transcriptional regulator
VARRVGVSRGTVYNWTHRSQRFIEALESWQKDMANSARVRLLAMSGVAARAITAALEKGDAKVALAVFKGLGVMDPQRQEEPEEEKIIYRRTVNRGGED